MGITVFNHAQLEMLKMMSRVTDERILDDLRQAVSDFFARKAQEEIDHLWDSGELNEEKVERFKTLHERTPYK